MAQQHLSYANGFMRLLYATGMTILVAHMALAASEPEILCSNISPYVFEQQGSYTGYAYEIGVEVIKRLGYTGKIKVQPLPRANRSVQTKPNVMALWIGRIPEREKTVQWLYPLFLDDFSIYTLKGQPSALTLEQARKFNMLGANIGAANVIAAQHRGLIRIEMITSDDANGRKLMTKRIDGWIATHSAVMFFLQLHALPDDTFIKGVKLSDYQAWIAASHGTDPAVIDQWQKTLAAMEQDGTMRRLASKYRVNLMTNAH